MLSLIFLLLFFFNSFVKNNIYKYIVFIKDFNYFLIAVQLYEQLLSHILLYLVS